MSELKRLDADATLALRPDTVRLLNHFSYGHLPDPLAAISKPFSDLAQHLVASLGESPDLTKSLNELLAAKDWAVRSRLPLEGSN